MTFPSQQDHALFLKTRIGGWPMTPDEELTTQRMIELMDKLVTAMEEMHENIRVMVEVIRHLVEERK